jgi:hypothetical protein
MLGKCPTTELYSQPQTLCVCVCVCVCSAAKLLFLAKNSTDISNFALEHPVRSTLIAFHYR